MSNAACTEIRKSLVLGFDKSLSNLDFIDTELRVSFSTVHFLYLSVASYLEKTQGSYHSPNKFPALSFRCQFEYYF